MDDLTKKLMPQLDDPTPGVRTAAMERLHEYMPKAIPPETFRGFIQDIEEAQTAKQRVSILETELQQYKEANRKAQLRYIAAQRVLAWVSAYRRPVAAGAAAVVVGLVGIKTATAVWSWSPSLADKAAFEKVVRAKEWREGWTDPAVEPVNGVNFWFVTEGKIDRDSYANAAGQPIEKRCLHLYVSKASPIFDDYFRPNAFDWSGSIKWPEVAMHCGPVPQPMEIAGVGTPRPVPGEATEKPISDKPQFDFGKPVPRDDVDFGPGKPIRPEKKGKRQ